jgi:hypothetical protein
MFVSSVGIVAVVVFSLWKCIHGNELTFELSDNAKECFHDELKIGSRFTLEFQVCFKKKKKEKERKKKATRVSLS